MSLMTTRDHNFIISIVNSFFQQIVKLFHLMLITFWFFLLCFGRRKIYYPIHHAIEVVLMASLRGKRGDSFSCSYIN